MATELAISQERQERIAKLKRFLAPQVAELVDRKGDDGVLEGRRTEVVVVFCDLRGFTPFSAKATPDEVMTVLSEYYDALGRIITQYAATLTSFSGDGVMVILNAPVPIAEPALRAVDMAMAMQRSVQGGWLAATGAVLAALAIAASAYASHGLADAHARGNLQTAGFFAFAHGAMLLVLAQMPARRLRGVALSGLLLGTLLFAGSLTAGALLGWPTRLAPFGGTLLMASWLLLAANAVRR